MPKIKGQENQRQSDVWVDQYRREYYVNLEIATGDPIDLRPLGWTAPLEPAWARGLLLPPVDDHQVVTLVPRAERSRKGYQIHVDHAAWLGKLYASRQAYTQRLHQIAQNMSGGVNVLEIIQNPPPSLREFVGEPPFPPVEFVQAMLAGNEWALGLSDAVPAKALALLEAIKPVVLSARAIVAELVDPLEDEAVRRARAELADDAARGGASAPGAPDPLADGSAKPRARRPATATV